MVQVDKNERKIYSVIVGESAGTIFKVEYQLRTTMDWTTTYLEVKSQLGEASDSLIFYGDGTGNWHANGQPLEAFKGCIDVDLPLSPFTNTLPINRLQLDVNTDAMVKVIYVDLTGHEIKPVMQKYTRRSHNEYKYENVPNDFEAVIKVDGGGFVTDYPTLFKRIAKSDYETLL